MTTPRRAGLAIFIAVALLVSIDSAIWFWATSRMIQDWQVWRVQEAAAGLRLQSASPRRGGWPLTAEIILPAITADGGPASWGAEAARLSVSPLHPASLTVAVQGQQILQLDGLPAIVITARGLTATVPFSDPQRVTFEAHSLTASVDGRVLEIGVLAGSANQAGLAIDLSHMTIPAAGLPFGGAIDHLTAHFHATVPLLLPGAAAPSAIAAAWARAGGQIVVDTASILWGPLDARGHFTAGLDSALQPTASGTLHMSGYHDAVGALVRAGTIGRNVARVATTVLDMMATSTDPATVDVPLTLRGGSLSMGAIPLLRVPPITWP